MKNKEKISPDIIPSHFKLMGEGEIPQEEFKGLDRHHIKIFLTESDPNKWPMEISHLKKFVQKKQNA